MTRIERTDLARDALYDKVNQIADEQVSLADNQTITGNKTFQGRMDSQSTVAIKGETGTARYWGIGCYDKNGTGNTNRLSLWQTWIGENGDSNTALCVYKNEANTNTYATFKITYPLTGSPYATCPDPTDTTSSTNSKQIPTVGWGNIHYVTLDTSQTITGAKTFSQNILLTSNAQSYRHIYSNNTSITKGTAPSTNIGYDYVFRDSAGSNVCAIGGWYNTNGNIYAALYAYNPTAGSTTHADLRVGNYASGRADVVFETPTGVANSCLDGETNSTTSNMVALKGWVNNPATATNVVHRTGNETIAGTKTFSSTISGSISGNAATVTNGVYTTGNQTIRGTKTFSSTISGSINGNAATVTNGVYTTGSQTISGNKTFSGATKFTADPSVTRDYAGFNLNASNITKGTGPEADTLYSRYRLRDKDGTIMSSVYGIYRSNRSNQLGFEVMKANANSDTAYSRLALIVAADGTAYGICPTPEVSASGTTIATAGYINNKFKKVSTLPASPDANTFYFIPE